MTSRVEEFKVEQKAKNQISTLPRTEDSLIPPPTASETKGLLRPTSSTKNTTNLKKANSATDHHNQTTEESLKVTLEAGILSLNDQEFKDRDKSVNPDLV